MYTNCIVTYMLVSVSVRIGAVFKYSRTKMLDAFSFRILFVSSCTSLLASIIQPFAEGEMRITNGE